jgi:predicted transcriptional regulator
MTKLFKRGIEAIEALPPDQQDLAGQLLLDLAGQADRRSSLTPEQIEDLKLSLAEADRGEFATDEEMEQVWKSFER